MGAVVPRGTVGVKPGVRIGLGGWDGGLSVIKTAIPDIKEVTLTRIHVPKGKYDSSVYLSQFLVHKMAVTKD